MLTRYILIASMTIFLSVITYSMLVSMTLAEEKSILITALVTILLLGIPGLVVNITSKRKAGKSIKSS